MSNDPNKKASPNKKYWTETNGALLNIASREKKSERYSLALNKYELGKPIIFRWSADSSAVGMFIAKAVPYDAGGYTLSRNNYWIGIWYPFRDKFAAWVLTPKIAMSGARQKRTSANTHLKRVVKIK